GERSRLRPDLVPGHEHLEPLEHAPALGGLEAGVADQDLGPHADALQAVPEGHRQGERPEVVRGLDGAQDPEAPGMHAPPDAFELVPRCLPLVELPLADASPALQAAHGFPLSSLRSGPSLCSAAFFEYRASGSTRA